MRFARNPDACALVHIFPCARVALQVIGVALQASQFGSLLQAYYSAGDRAAGAGAELMTASAMLALLLIALWSLLSQLLEWSDAAVLKVRAALGCPYPERSMRAALLAGLFLRALMRGARCGRASLSLSLADTVGRACDTKGWRGGLGEAGSMCQS